MRALGPVLMLALLGATARAQEVSVLAPPATRCLTAAGGSSQPVYPPHELRAGRSAEVAVDLTFTSPDGEPTVKVLSDANEADFVQAVRDHVEKLRLPCLEASEVPARLVQRYIFKPDSEPVRWTTNDPEASDRERRLKCLTRPADGPKYPERALREGAEGRLYAMLTFTAPDQAPEVSVHGAPRAVTLFRPAIEDWVKEQRVPCLQGTALRASALFIFRLEGNGHYGFKDLQFVQFLGLVKGLRKQSLQFDTTTMGCPFDVRIAYLQPYLHNRVAQIGEPHLARLSLLNWLATAELDLSERERASVFGDGLTFTVPCIKIDLKPKE